MRRWVEGGARKRPADTQARRNDLREAAEIHDPVTCARNGIGECGDGFYRLACEGELAVWVVFAQHKTEPHREPCKRLTTRHRQRRAGRVREGRHRVEQLRACAWVERF